MKVTLFFSYNVSQWDSRLWEKKNYKDKTKLNPAARDNTLRSKDTKRSALARNWKVFIYIFFPLIHHIVQPSWARSQQPAREASSSACFTANRRLISQEEAEDVSRFELKICFLTKICVLLKKQSHLHLGCPWGKQINIKLSFLGKLFF